MKHSYSYNQYVRRRKIRKIKRQIYKIINAPYYLLHFTYLSIVKLFSSVFGVRIKLKNIVNGWANYIVEDPVVEQVAARRAKICSQCKHAVKMKITINDIKITDVNGLKCNLCNCPLSAKTRSSDDHCPLSKW